MTTYEEQLKLFNDNQKLVYLALHKYFPDKAFDEEMQLNGLESLWKACTRYDIHGNNSVSFSTYAMEQIKLDVLCIYRDEARHNGVLNDSCSLDSFVSDHFESDDGENPTMYDIIESKETNMIIDDSKLKENEKQVFYLKLKGYTMREIADKLGKSRTHVHRILHRAYNKVKDNIIYI